VQLLSCATAGQDRPWHTGPDVGLAGGESADALVRDMAKTTSKTDPRHDGRRPDELRPISIERGFVGWADGSVLIGCGRTRLICTASVVGGVPTFLRDTGQGWLTAEYDMLPASTSVRRSRSTRTGRVDGRSIEIQRFIGRSLRAVIDLEAIPGRTIWVDCDVVEADGGTRTLAITGGYLALVEALRTMEAEGKVPRWPLRDSAAAVSVGVVDGRVLVDLDYAEDRDAEVDMNVVMTGGGRLIEVQGAAEGRPFSATRLAQMLTAARRAVTALTRTQQSALAER